MEIDPIDQIGAAGDMRMPVDKSGQDSGTVGVDDMAIRAGQLPDLRARPDGNEFAVPNREGPGRRTGRIGGPDIGVDDNLIDTAVPRQSKARYHNRSQNQDQRPRPMSANSRLAKTRLSVHKLAPSPPPRPHARPSNSELYKTNRRDARRA